MTPRRRNKIQIISIISVSFIVLVFVIYHIFFTSNSFWRNSSAANEYEFPHIFLDKERTRGIYSQILKNPKSETFNGEKLIHLDLKGAPPLVPYLRQFFPYIRNLGATGILIEYEDMFFYKEELEGIRALNAYSPSTIKTILELAEMNNLSVIPLIQTFGHFEFVLKLEKFKALREIKAYPQVLCPSHERVLPVIKQMIDQVLEAHPKAKYIHIGCDEVMYLGECEKCKSVLHQNEWTTAQLFLNHVKSIALYINRTYTGVRPIMWGDMIGRFRENLVRESQISSLVDLMVWKYVPNVSDYITQDLLDMYARIFKTIWIASAFKGATGVNQIITDVKYHLANHISWMEIVSKWKNLINFKGIAITGWQRYDHFAELCELLPVAIPSLTLSLHYLGGAEKGTSESDLLKILQCHPPVAFSPSNFEYFTQFGKCEFPGFLVYQLIYKFYSLSSKISNHFSVVYGGWFSVYNVLHRFSSPAYVKDIFDKWPLNEHRNELKALEEDLKKALLELYDEFTVEEWITTNVTPIRLRLEAFYNAKEAMLGHDVWPRRPLLNNTDGLERAAREICTSDRKFGCALLLI